MTDDQQRYVDPRVTIRRFAAALTLAFDVFGDGPAEGGLLEEMGEFLEAVDRVVATLPSLGGGKEKRNHELFRYCYGLRPGTKGKRGPQTLVATGKAFDITKERVRQIMAKQLRMLRHPSRSKQLRGPLAKITRVEW